MKLRLIKRRGDSGSCYYITQERSYLVWTDVWETYSRDYVEAREQFERYSEHGPQAGKMIIIEERKSHW